jgi:hypothetical protein
MVGPSSPNKHSFSLENILGNHENLEDPKFREEDKLEAGWDEEAAEKPVEAGFCIECEGEPSESLAY